MPTYEYHCNECGHEMETFQSITAKPLKKCPECGKNTLERLISGGGAIIFKGAGFYETDYRSKDYKQKAEAEKKAGEGPTKETAKETPKQTPKEKPADKSPAHANKTKPAGEKKAKTS